MYDVSDYDIGRYLQMSFFEITGKHVPKIQRAMNGIAECFGEVPAKSGLHENLGDTRACLRPNLTDGSRDATVAHEGSRINFRLMVTGANTLPAGAEPGAVGDDDLGARLASGAPPNAILEVTRARLLVQIGIGVERRWPPWIPHPAEDPRIHARWRGAGSKNVMAVQKIPRRNADVARAHQLAGDKELKSALQPMPIVNVETHRMVIDRADCGYVPDAQRSRDEPLGFRTPEGKRRCACIGDVNCSEMRKSDNCKSDLQCDNGQLGAVICSCEAGRI
jgi:hypothetical protein